MRKYILKLLICGLFFASACAKKEIHTYSDTDPLAGFDTLFSYSESTYDKNLFHAHFEAGRELFFHYSSLFDIYNNYQKLNNLKTVNDNAGKQPVKVDPEIIEMLKLAQDFYRYSDGKFDVTIGALTRVWHDYRENGILLNSEGKKAPVPEKKELEKAYGCHGWDQVEINEEDSTVFLKQDCMALDVGGIAKGYAAEKIALALEKEKAVSGNVNAGRNLRTIGTKPDGSAWRIGIADPNSETGESIMIVSIPGSMSFVTSGDYERFYIGEDGRSYHHIVDPDTLFPADYYRSVTVITEDSGAADCLSTALFTMSVEDGKKTVEAYEAETGKNVDIIWIMEKEKAPEDPHSAEKNGLVIIYTEGLEGKIAL